MNWTIKSTVSSRFLVDDSFDLSMLFYITTIISVNTVLVMNSALESKLRVFTFQTQPRFLKTMMQQAPIAICKHEKIS